MTLRTLSRASLLGVCGALLVAPTALGHAKVDKRVPASGASLSSGPKTVYVAFTAQVRPGAKLTVKRGSTTVIRGKNDPRNVKRVIGKSSRRLAKGTYRVTWSATYLDGHKESGKWSFRVR
jgi:methionine-rich copper-binding protein CopC